MYVRVPSDTEAVAFHVDTDEVSLLDADLFTGLNVQGVCVWGGGRVEGVAADQLTSGGGTVR